MFWSWLTLDGAVLGGRQADVIFRVRLCHWLYLSPKFISLCGNSLLFLLLSLYFRLPLQRGLLQ